MRTMMLVAAILAASGCGGTAVDVQGTYVGTCAGSLTILGFTVPWDGGSVTFTLTPSGDVFTAAGALSVKPKVGNAYNANIGGTVANGHASMTFTAIDGKSSGTMSGDISGSCWQNGTWTVTSVGGTGTGTWQACRQ